MKIHTLLGWLGGLLLLSSCNSFLDIQPEGKVIPNTLEDYRQLLTTAYNETFYDRAMADLRSDETTVDASEYDQSSYGNIEKWNDTSSDGSTQSFGWGSYYETIFYANSIIDKRKDITTGTEAEINQLVGEAYMMRAYQHFLLANLYGQPYTKEGAPDTKAVPLKLNVDLEGVPARNTLKDVYTSILNDLETAKKLMNVQEWENLYKYRFTPLAAAALEARAYLYMGQWQKAYDAAEQVLSQKNDLVDMNTEDILPNDYTSKEIINANELIYNSSMAKAALIRKSFVDTYYKQGDLRPAKFFGTPGEDGNYPCNKGGSTQDRCSFRTGEMYLISAEAAAHLGNVEAAANRLLQLMKHRYTPAMYATLEQQVKQMDSNALLKETLDERARELVYEGHRWFDLRRTTRPEIKKVFNGTTYTLQQDDGRYTLQIPKEAIEANPGLKN